MRPSRPNGRMPGLIGVRDTSRVSRGCASDGRSPPECDPRMTSCRIRAARPGSIDSGQALTPVGIPGSRSTSGDDVRAARAFATGSGAAPDLESRDGARRACPEGLRSGCRIRTASRLVPAPSVRMPPAFLANCRRTRNGPRRREGRVDAWKADSRDPGQPPCRSSSGSPKSLAARPRGHRFLDVRRCKSAIEMAANAA